MDEPTNLIINYLPQSLSDDEFRSMFLSIGPVKSTKVIRDKNTGYSYGFGFVDYAMHADAKRAIETLNGLQLQHKTIKVAFSRQGEENRGGNLYVTNIGRNLTTNQLSSIFSPYGELVQCRIVCDKHTGLSKGIGFVLFMRKNDAENAINHLNGTTPDGCSEAISIKFAMDNRDKAKGMISRIGNNALHQAFTATPTNTNGTNFGPSQNDYYDEFNYSGMSVNAAMNYAGRGAFGRGGMIGGGRGDGPQWCPAPYGAGPMRRDNGGPGGRRRFNPMAVPPPHTPAQPGQFAEEGHVLFVYNIGTDATESTLWSLFAPFGAVSNVNVIVSNDTKQCKGYGFVTMNNYQDALNAIKNLDGCPFGAKTLQVSFKRTDKMVSS